MNNTNHQKTINEPILLDCTFRDGGYYNNWDYSPQLANKYLDALDRAQVQICEIGFRSPTSQSFKGPLYYSTDSFLHSLNVPKSITLAVMINAKDFIFPYPIKKLTDRFPSNELVKIVRIACIHSEVPKLKEVVGYLNSNGFRVIVNLMQANALSHDELQKAVEKLRSFNHVEVLYLADSFGDMKPTTVSEKFRVLKTLWPNKLGFHAHDNMGLALVNTLSAWNAGVTYLDSTLLGMGRGAGNVRTEELMLELKSSTECRYQPEELFEIVQTDFRDLQSKYSWGKNLEYYIAAQYGIHPTYVQEMLSKGKIEGKTFLSAMNSIRNSGKGSSYSEENLVACLANPETDERKTDFSHEQKFLPISKLNIQKNTPQKIALILGSAEGTELHEHHIRQFKKHWNPFVLGSSAKSTLSLQISNLFFASHYSKIFAELDVYKNIQANIVLPMNILPAHLAVNLSTQHFYNFSLNTSHEQFSINEDSCTVPSLDSLAYGLCIAVRLGFETIVLAGFEGYEKNSEKQESMNLLFSNFKKFFPKTILKSITPTFYAIDRISPYQAELNHE
jgi:4-hydroxy 2-oxovalerate aldolase